MVVRLRRPLCLTVVAFFLAPALTLANVAPPDPRNDLKKELAAFFAQVDDRSLAALGAIKKSPETLKAINNQIDGMSDQQVAKLRETIGALPTPNAITEMFPPAAREAMRKAPADPAAFARQAEETRDDVLTMTQVLKRLPDAKLRELGIERARVEQIEAAFTHMPLVDAAAIQAQLAADEEWQTQSEKALGTLPPVVRRGAVALAKHGPITPQETASLESFRGELITRLQRIDALPTALQKKLNIEGVETKIAEVGTASPDALFMMQQEFSAEKVAELDKALALLERVAKLTPEDIEGLNRFRTELTSVYAPLQANAAAADELGARLAALAPADLLMLQQRLGSSPEMAIAAPAMYRALSTPGFAERIAALQQPSPDPAVVHELELFRADALRYIDAAEVEPELAGRARQAVASATPAKLEFIRALNQNLPEQTSARTRLTIVANEINCTIWIGGVAFDFNWLCTPIIGAVNVIGATLDMAIAALKSTIDIMAGNFWKFASDLNALYTAFNDFTGGITTIVNSIWNTVTTIANGFATVGTLVAAAVGSAFNALMAVKLPGEPYSVQELVDFIMGESGIRAPLEMVWDNIDGPWWAEILNKPVPNLACPASNTLTPFGVVGTRVAAEDSDRIKYMLDTLLDLVPSTELSLIPKFHMVYAVGQFRGLAVCLKQAAERTAATEATSAETVRLNTILNDAAGNRNLLANQLTVSFSSMANLIGSSSNAITAMINDRSKEETDLNLRLQVEINLTAKQPLAMFQLPRSNGGYLEVARDVVNQAITAMLAAAQNVGKAPRYYEDAVAAMGLGKYKDAYLGFQAAYLELTAR